MNKESQLQAFLRAMKTAFKNASIYRVDHPIFQQSVEVLYKKLNGLLTFMVPIHLGFSASSILVEGKYRDEDQYIEELAKIFHYRKIRSVEIEKGVDLDELTYFVTKLSAPPREIIMAGGPAHVLRDELIHIQIEELDYSELLKGEGEEIKDIWVNLLHEALKEQDSTKIVELSKSFSRVIKAFTAQEMIEKRDLIEGLTGFFTALEKANQNRFQECSKDYLRTVMSHKETWKDEDFAKLLMVSSTFKEKDIATTFWEEILTNEKFDSLEFRVMTRLVQKDRHEKVNFSLSKIFHKNESLHSNPDVKKKLGELLKESSSPMISELYRNTLHRLLMDITYEGEMGFDHDQLLKNYVFILLNRMEAESEKKQLISLLNDLANRWEKIKESRDYESLKVFHQVLTQKAEQIGEDDLYQKVMSELREYVESSLLDGELSLFFEYFVNNFDSSAFDVNVYLEKIFSEGKVTPYTLKAFFKFFKEYLFYFNLNLDEYSSDSRLIEKVIGSLQLIPTPVSLVILKNIYRRADKRLRLRILQVMKDLSLYDHEFLLPILREKDPFLKSTALMILMTDETVSQDVLTKFMSARSFFGMGNRRLIDHIKIVNRFEIREALPFLTSLSNRKFFWNRKIRMHAAKVLERWNVT